MTGNPRDFDPDNFTGKYILRYRKPVPCTNLMKWAYWIERNHRRVRHTIIGDTRISTVFLGLDHKFCSDTDEPILFETMIFPSGDMYRCSTWRQALKQHWDAVDEVHKQNR